MNNKKLITKTVYFFIIFSYFLFSSSLSSQTKNDTSYSGEKIEEMLNIQLEAYPHEKIHLHTDRDYYIPGEKIWFKAYVVDAHSHLYPTFSKYVYVELISPSDTLVCRVMVQQTDDMFYGHLSISDAIQEGNYTLRAYTRYMENLGDDYFFKKNIRIAGNVERRGSGGNRVSEEINNYELRITNYEKNTESESDFDVSFFPEGGNLVEGALAKVAFKALKSSGMPATISGKLINGNGAEITTVETIYAGMGIFVYTPVSGEKIYFLCRDENGFEKRFELPQPSSQAYTITASRRNNNLIVEIQSSAKAPDIPFYLLAHCRGMLLHFSVWDKEKKAAVFALDQFPAGVIQFVLFDGQMNPLSERLVFSKNNPSSEVEFQTDKTTYGIREKVTATITSFLLGRIVEGIDGLGDFSVSVTDDTDIAVDESTTILSSLLLSSELKGYIENPAYYLQDNPASNAALDLLMMTHGWRRYNIPEVAKGNPSYPQIPFQLSQEISGQVKSSILSRPVSDSEILVMMQDGGVGVTSTDRNGLFVVQGLEFPDSTTFYIRALSKRGSGNLQLFIDNESFPELVYAPQNPLSRLKIIETEDKSDMNDFVVKAKQRAKYEEDIWTIQLNEVEVTAPRIKRDEARLQFWANKSSDATITRAVMEQFSHTYVTDYLLHTSGVMVYPNGAISIRGSKGLPLVFIDGVEQYWPENGMYSIAQSPLERVSISAIESIDVFKGFGKTVFGMRGANGVISITTKRGENTPYTEKTNSVIYAPLGYQKPANFYSPKYETLEEKQSNLPDYRTTIFWKPDVVISDDSKASFEFYSSDFRTNFSIVIEGITNDGKIVRNVEKIRVE